MDFGAMSFGASPSYGEVKAERTPSPKKSPSSRVQREAHGVLPVTVQTLRTAAARQTDQSKFVLFGLPAGKVVVCGTVTSAQVVNTNKQYMLDDETGSVLVKDYSEHCPVAAEGEMVRAVGEARMEGSELFVSVIQLVVLSDPVALGYHRILSTLAHCELTEGSPGPLDFTPVKTEAAAPAGNVKDIVLAKCTSADESGINVAALVAACGDAKAVRDALSALADEGRIYTTVDYDTFAAA